MAETVTMQRRYLLTVMAVAEGGTGLMLLLVPTVVLSLLLDIDSAAREAIVVSRVAGAALVAISTACWLARVDQDSPAQRGLVIGLLIYDVAAAALLAHAGWQLDMTGIALWPAIVAHVGLGAWSAIVLGRDKTDQ